MKLQLYMSGGKYLGIKSIVIWTESKTSTASTVLKLSVVIDDSNSKGQKNVNIFLFLSW